MKCISFEDTISGHAGKILYDVMINHVSSWITIRRPVCVVSISVCACLCVYIGLCVQYGDGKKRRKPNYSSVDLSEVEWEDKDDTVRSTEPRTCSIQVGFRSDVRLSSSSSSIPFAAASCEMPWLTGKLEPSPWR